MKCFKPLLFLIAPLLLSGCSGSEPTPTTTSVNPSQTSGQVTFEMQGVLGTNSHQITVDWNDNCFKESATTLNDDLKMLSFASSMVSHSTSTAGSFFGTIGFSNLQGSFGTPNAETMGYILASKTIADFEVVALSIRGLNYGAEWSNNLKVGQSGDHAGFAERADEMYGILKEYLKSYSDKNVKLWISGYSRAGGIANVLASKLMKGTEIVANENNLFVYTFEAPRGLSQENAVAYNNVFNFVNSFDLVAQIAPEAYGLYRCGKDIIINENKNPDELLAAFDPNLALPAFRPNETYYPTEQDFSKYILNELLKDTEEAETNLNTRDAFYQNYQGAIAHFMALYFSLPTLTANKIKSGLQSMSAYEIFVMLSDNDGLYKFIKAILDEDSIPYEESQLQPTCYSLTLLVRAKITLVYNIYSDENGKSNLSRTLMMHTPDLVYVLIK